MLFTRYYVSISIQWCTLKSRDLSLWCFRLSKIPTLLTSYWYFDFGYLEAIKCNFEAKNRNFGPIFSRIQSYLIFCQLHFIWHFHGTLLYSGLRTHTFSSRFQSLAVFPRALKCESYKRRSWNIFNIMDGKIMWKSCQNKLYHPISRNTCCIQWLVKTKVYVALTKV